MNTRFGFVWLPSLLVKGFCALTVLAFSFCPSRAQGVGMSIETSEGQTVLRWDGADGSQSFELDFSQDLRVWESADAEIEWVDAGADSHFEARIPSETPVGFYRLRLGARIVALASTSEELFGFSDALRDAYERLGPISVDEFVERYDLDADLLDGVSYDPIEAQYWDEFDAPADPEVVPLFWTPERRMTDFRLNSEEREKFETNGFVVSGRLGAHSFAEVYYRIFTDDLPVFVSADSVLNAWHQNYATMFGEIEDLFLIRELNRLIFSLRRTLPRRAPLLSPALADSVNDVDYYLTVAASLVSGRTETSSFGHVDDLVAETLAAVEEGALASFPLFGRAGEAASELFDFSQFKPRGRYTRSVDARRFFRTLMWLGRVDFRVAGSAQYASAREMGAAAILVDLLEASGGMSKYEAIDSVLKSFVGDSDSMTPSQLKTLLGTADVSGAEDIEDLETLESIQAAIESSELGVQQILSHLYFTTPGSAPIKLPRAFLLFGQRFTPDSWMMGKLVYDRVRYGEDELALRRIPSSLEVAFSALGARQATPWLAHRIRATDGMAFRDGQPIQQQAGALFEVFDSMPRSSWERNVYLRWLGALRTLNSSRSNASMPEVFRTRAWSDRLLSTQLASWTQLRHDTVLFVKQSSTPPLLCSFPHAYVEPNPEFWSSMAALAGAFADAIEEARQWTSSGFVPSEARFGPSMTIREALQAQGRHLRQFSETMGELAVIAEKQLAQEDLTEAETTFLRDIIEREKDYVGVRTYSGWYADLYYHPVHGFEGNDDPADRWDPVVTDVHTDGPAIEVGDPGGVLHEGVSHPSLLMVSINCDAPRVYAGPVFTHFEWMTEPGVFERMTNEEWGEKLESGDLPAAPEWTDRFYVPASEGVLVPEDAKDGHFY